MQGLCPEGKGGSLVDNGNNTYGRRYVVNLQGTSAESYWAGSVCWTNMAGV